MTSPPPFHRALEWNEPPSAPELGYAGWTVVRPAAAPAPSWLAIARIADVHLYLAPPGCAADAPVLYAEPVVAAKRARRGSGVEVGVDGSVCTSAFHPAAPGLTSPPGPPCLPWDEMAAEAEAHRRTASRPRISVAVIDTSFDNIEAVDVRPEGALEGPYVVGLPTEPARPPLSGAPAHGTAMAGIVLHEAPATRVGLFRVPSVLGAVPAYAGTTSLAMAVAAAVEAWEADVVLIAMSDGAWGTPRPLRDVLRAAARAGRGGRGAALFCSVGDPSRNHPSEMDSAALGADDLASQPWVQAIAACDARGRWYRAQVDYRPEGSAVYNRFGPAVALSALGEPRCFGARIAADDSSQATALAAAAGARTLAVNPGLHLAELRAVLAVTADVVPVVDGGRGLGAGVFDRRDRAGHSLKLGHGRVNAIAARLAAADPVCLSLLATREVPDPGQAGPGSPALMLAQAWDQLVRGAEGLGRGYLPVRARASRLVLRSLALQEALGWWARHARALHGPDGADGLAGWAAPTQDHGALPARLLHVVDALRDAARECGSEPGDEVLLAWLGELEGAVERMIADGDGAAIARPLAMCLAAAHTLARSAAGLPEALQGWYGADVVVEVGDDGRGGQA